MRSKGSEAGSLKRCAQENERLTERFPPPIFHGFGPKLFMANVFRSPLPVERQNLQMPLHGKAFGKEADLAVAGLILDLSRNGQGFAFRAQGVAEVRGGADLDVLPDAEGSGENGYALFDGRQIERFRGRINRRPQLSFRGGIDRQLDWLIVQSSGSVHVNVRRELYFGRQGDEPSGKGSAVGLLEREPQMRSFGGARDFCAQFRKQLGDDVIAGKALAILGLEEFLADDAPGVEDEKSGARHALELAGRFGVKDVVGANGLGIGIGQ